MGHTMGHTTQYTTHSPKKSIEVSRGSDQFDYKTTLALIKVHWAKIEKKLLDIALHTAFNWSKKRII